MKKNFINRVIILLMFVFVSANLFSQGVYIYTKDGQCQNFSHENVDSIVFYMNENTIPNKKLVQIVEEDENYVEGKGKDIDIYYFEYNNQGQLVSVTEDDKVYTIEYSENLITSTRYKGDERYEIVTFRLSDGKIISGKEEHSGIPTYTHSYTYISNHLAETIGDMGNVAFVWEGDKLINVSNGIDDYAYSLDYDGNTCNGYNPAIIIMLASDIMYEAEYFPIITNPELAGFRTNQLPKSMIEDDEVTNFTYEFDDDGYLRKCKAAENDGDYTIYTFTWE